MLDRRDARWLLGCAWAVVLVPTALIFALTLYGNKADEQLAGELCEEFVVPIGLLGAFYVFKSLVWKAVFRRIGSKLTAKEASIVGTPIGDLGLQARSTEVVCPFCKDAVDLTAPHVACEKCRTRHHASCFRDNGRCAVFGCGETRPEIYARGERGGT